jgi:deoxyadenosine/deoxycytidine kinase
MTYHQTKNATTVTKVEDGAEEAVVIPPIIVIEGNISAGKTTLLKSIQTVLAGTKENIIYYQEPLARDIPYLDAFYKNPKKYIHKLQHWFMAQRLQNFHELIEKVKKTKEPEKKIKAIIMDRCIYSDLVFLNNALDTGLMTQQDYDTFIATRKLVQRDMPIPTLLLNLHVHPEECFRRIHQLRNEPSESKITLDYLVGIDKCYKEYFIEMEAIGTAVTTLDWNNFGEAARGGENGKQEQENVTKIIISIIKQC